MLGVAEQFAGSSGFMLKTWLITDLPFLRRSRTSCLILFGFSGSRRRWLRQFEDNLPPPENNQQPSALWADCNETGIYFLLPPPVAALRHDWAYVELFTAPAAQGEGRKKNTKSNRQPAVYYQLGCGGDAVRPETETGPDTETARNRREKSTSCCRRVSERRRRGGTEGCVALMRFKYVFL